jgi:hypothetical protein
MLSWHAEVQRIETADIISTNRRVGGIRVISSSKKGAIVQSQIEMDSHADTTVAGSNCVVIYYTGKECDISPYITDACKAIKSVPIVQAGTAYDNIDTGETFILVFNEAIWMGDKMDHTLVNPNQLRSFGITVQDNAFSDAPTYVSTEGKEFYFPLDFYGAILSAPTRTPTEHELQTCTHVVLSSEHD